MIVLGVGESLWLKNSTLLDLGLIRKLCFVAKCNREREREGLPKFREVSCGRHLELKRQLVFAADLPNVQIVLGVRPCKATGLQHHSDLWVVGVVNAHMLRGEVALDQERLHPFWKPMLATKCAT